MDKTTAFLRKHRTEVAIVTVVGITALVARRRGYKQGVTNGYQAALHQLATRQIKVTLTEDFLKAAKAL